MSRWGSTGIFDASQRTKNLQTRAVVTNTLEQLAAVNNTGKPFMHIQAASPGQGGPVNVFSIAAETGSANLTQAEYDAIMVPPPPQVYLPAPLYDLSGIHKNGNNLTIAWHPVEGATHYRVCIKIGFNQEAFNVLDLTINNDPANINIRGHASTAKHFDVISDLITGTNFIYNMPDVVNEYTICVFSYNNVRGQFPTTKLYYTNESISQNGNPPFRYVVETYGVCDVIYSNGATDFDAGSNTLTKTYKNLYSGEILTTTMYLDWFLSSSLGYPIINGVTPRISRKIL